MSKAAKARRAEYRKALRALTISNGDIVLIRNSTELATSDAMTALAGHLGRTGRGDCVLVIVDRFDDLASLNRSAMEEQGWKWVGKG